jgi:hypothetical protein
VFDLSTRYVMAESVSIFVINRFPSPVGIADTCDGSGACRSRGHCGYDQWHGSCSTQYESRRRGTGVFRLGSPREIEFSEDHVLAVL